MAYSTRQFIPIIVLILASALPKISAGEPSGGQTTLYLNATMQPFEQPKAVTGYLEREFARQAVLMAARDMGCATRDIVLREAFPPAPRAQDAVLDIEV